MVLVSWGLANSPIGNDIQVTPSLKIQLPASATAKVVAPDQGAAPLPPSTSSRSMLSLRLLGLHLHPSLASTSEPSAWQGELTPVQHW